MGALLSTLDKSTVRQKRRKLAYNHKENSISEEGTVLDILQLRRNRGTKTAERGAEHHGETVQRVFTC